MVSEHISDTHLTLEMNVGESFIELPKIAQQDLLTQAIYQLAGVLVRDVADALKAGESTPFIRSVSVELMNTNSVEGQNLLSDLDIGDE